MNTACYIGSFDPLTNGHLDIIRRSLKMFDYLYVAIGVNPNKKTLFSDELRLDLLNNAIKNPVNSIDYTRVKVTSFTGLAHDFMLTNGISVSVRGIRNNTDLEYENNMMLANKEIGNIETIYIPCDPKLSHVSSSNVKELAKAHINVESLVPMQVKFQLEAVLHGITKIAVLGKSGAGKSTFCRELGFPVLDYDRMVSYLWNLDKYRDLRGKMGKQLYNLNNDIVSMASYQVCKQVMREFISDKNNNAKVREIMKPYIEVVYRDCINTLLLNLNKTSIGLNEDEKLSRYNKNKDFITKFPEFAYLFSEYPTNHIMLVDAPMLVEYDGLGQANCNVIYIDAPTELCVKRIVDRDNISMLDALKRINSQMTLESFESQYTMKRNQTGFGNYAKRKYS